MLVLLLLAGVPSRMAAESKGSVPEMRILARYEIPLGHNPEREAHWMAPDGEKRVHVPEGASPALDIRWAGEDSVYLAQGEEGVWEMSLGDKLAPRRRLVPDARTLGRVHLFDHLAVSPDYLAFASSSTYLAWRSLGVTPDGSVRFDRQEVCVTSDLDLRGDRLLLLGDLCDQNDGEFWAANGAIAWLGTLRGHDLADFKPVLYDSAGPQAPHLDRCGVFGIGAARFLPDGSFLVVPGFQPGATLFDAAGHPIRTWSGPETGIDTDCAALEEKPGQTLKAQPYLLAEWLNRHHVLDDILPLPGGPGLLIRFLGEDKKIHWRLRILEAGGARDVEVPITSGLLAAHLRGDVRDGRIVLLLSSYLPFLDGAKSGEVLVVGLVH